MKRIGIEAQKLFSRNKHGMDVVAMELIRNLQIIDHHNEYVIFVQPGEDKCLQPTKNFRFVEVQSSSLPVWEQYELPRAAKHEKVDILHCTSNTAPLFLNIPLVVSLHDIMYLESFKFLGSNDTLRHKLGNLYRRFIVPRIVKTADRIITVSEFERKRICNFMHIDMQKVNVVYNGVGDHFKPVTEPKVLNGIRQKYNLPPKYILFFGSTDPKKNTEKTLKAYVKYVLASSQKLALVIPDYPENQLESILSKLGHPALRERIYLPGYVVNTDLPAIYSMADAFLYPSLHESFGIPPLEAMACGTPVITSNTSAMPEICGEGATFVDPTRSETITQALLRLQNDDELRNQLIHSGFQRWPLFTWHNTAQATLAIYNDMLEQ
jgi:glycosyltransferase involved in cell wall biosynthesis